MKYDEKWVPIVESIIASKGDYCGGFLGGEVTCKACPIGDGCDVDDEEHYRVATEWMLIYNNRRSNVYDKVYEVMKEFNKANHKQLKPDFFPVYAQNDLMDRLDKAGLIVVFK